MTIATEIEKLPYASLSLTKLFLTVFNKVKNNDVILFMLPSLIVYFAAHLLFWPGQMSPDSHTQWEGAMLNGGIFSNYNNTGHPYLSTLWLLPGRFVGGSPAFVVLINYTLVSIFSALILCLFVDKYKINRKLCCIFSIVFPLIPVNFLLFTTLWKDIPYTIGFLILFYGSLRLIISENNSMRSTFVLIFIGLFLIFFMRFNGMVAVAGTLLSFLALKPSFKKIWFYMGLTMLSLFLLLRCHFVINNITEVPTCYNAMHSVHYLGYLLKNDVELEEEDIKFLKSVMPLEDWKKKYLNYGVGLLAHKGYFLNKNICTKEGQAQLNSVGIKYLIKYPFEFLAYKYINAIRPLIFFHEITTYVSPMAPVSFTHLPGARYVSKILYTPVSYFNNNGMSIIFAPWLYLYFCIIFYVIKILFSYKKEFSQRIIKQLNPLEKKFNILTQDNDYSKRSLLIARKNFLFLITPPAMNLISLIILNTDECYRYYYPTFVVSCFIFLLLLGQTKAQKLDS